MASSLSSLLQRTNLDDHDEILKAANETLKQSKNDLTAQHARIVAYLKTDRYDEALRAFKAAPDTLKAQAPLEWAYTLYRTEQLAKAEESLQSSPKTRGAALLQAQTAYRLEKFSRAEAIYKDLAANGNLEAGEETDLRINRGAIDAQAAWAGQLPTSSKPKLSSADLERFDMAFNAACGTLGRGEYQRAEFLLGRAKALCAADEDLTDEEKQDELLTIDAQLVYVSLLLGKTREAHALSGQLRVDEFSDSATKRIATANQLLASGHSSNPYVSQRLFAEAAKAKSSQSPFEFQRSLLAQNEFALDLAAHKHGAIANAARAAANGDGGVKNAWIGVFDAAAHARNQVGKEAIKEILPLLERRPHDVGLVLTIVQLYVLTNNLQTAVTLLEAFVQRLETAGGASNEDVRYAPGLVGAIATLYAAQNRIVPAKTELAKAATHWRHRRKDVTTSRALFVAAGAALVESGLEEDIALAQELYAEVAQLGGDDVIARAGLVASQAQPGTAESNSLPSVMELSGDLDLALLEEGGISKPAVKSPAGAGAAGTKRAAESSKGKPSKSKKIRKSRMPKEYDETKKPDPERWLPLRDRSNWRPKGKKKNRSQGGGGTQGGMSDEAGGSKTSASPGTVQSAPSNKAKKKKGKGK